MMNNLSSFTVGIAVGLGVASVASWAWNCRRVRNRKRWMFCTAIKKDKMDAYLKYHRAVWPEVEAGLRKYGVTLLTIHAPKDGGNVFQMYIETDPDVDMGKDFGAGSVYRSNTAVGQWESLMDSFFETGGWNLMDEIYTLTPYSSTNSEPPNYAS